MKNQKIIKKMTKMMQTKSEIDDDEEKKIVIKKR